MVDPIDGTRSFVAGKPEFTISVALVEDGEAVLACLLNPATNECFEAKRGAGASLNDRPLRLQPPESLETAHIVLSAGERKTRDFRTFFPAASRQHHRLARLQDGAGRRRPVRRLFLLAQQP